MAIQSSGAISNQDLADEFGGSTPHALSEYYRNGGLVPGNNTNVPESGTIALDDFYGAVNEIVHTQSSSTTNMQLSSTFGSNWGSSVPKRLIINSGVTVGATGSYALRINGSMGGSLVIQNYGSIQGQGGSANGGDGGNAIQADQTSNVTIINESGGQIYAGGGGGGKGGSGGTGGRGGNGGQGGGGQYTTTQHLGTGWDGGVNCNDSCVSNAFGGGAYCQGHQNSCNQCTSGNCNYDGSSDSWECTNCKRNNTYHTNGGSGGAGGNGGGGGAGGNGGRGRGYNQSVHNGGGGSGGSAGAYGSGGSGGGTNAGSGGSGGQGGNGGTGGTGGNGGDWGQNGGNGASGNTGATGATGNAGANGNRTGGSGGASGQSGSGGSSGSGGGSRGTYITNRGSLSFTNNGSVAGA